MPLKSLLALAVVFFGWRIFTEELGKQSYDWINTIKYMVTLFKV
jgi:type III secretion protein T